MARRMFRLSSFAEYQLNKGNVERAIKKQAKEEKAIIYGARAIQKQAPLFSRSTDDYDLFVKNSKKSAIKIERKVEKFTTRNDFYVKKGINPGTYKLKHVGYDGKKGTNDDIGIADYTNNPKPLPPFKIINGIRYRTIREEARIKKRILKDPMFKFRHKKDREDLARINLVKNFL